MFFEETDEREIEIDRALARAVMARFLARALGSNKKEPRNYQGWEQDCVVLVAAAAELDAGGGGKLLRCAWALASCDEPTPESRDRLFGHTLRGGVCAYETEYGRRETIQQAHELADLMGFYAAFGLEVGERTRERPDHIACELEFLEVLSLKEARALFVVDDEMLEITRKALSKFLEDHLGRFARAFASSLQHADDGYYGRLGDLFEVFISKECKRFEVTPGPSMLELRSVREQDVPMACGSGAGLVQIGDCGGLKE